MADPKVINYAGEQKIYNKEKVDELLDTKQDTLVPDVVVQDSVNVVTNSAVKAYVDAETQRAETAEGDLNDLNTTDKSNLVAAINEVKDSAYTVDEHVTAGSTNPVQNTLMLRTKQHYSLLKATQMIKLVNLSLVMAQQLLNLQDTLVTSTMLLNHLLLLSIMLILLLSRMHLVLVLLKHH